MTFLSSDTVNGCQRRRGSAAEEHCHHFAVSAAIHPAARAECACHEVTLGWSGRGLLPWPGR